MEEYDEVEDLPTEEELEYEDFKEIDDTKDEALQDTYQK